MRVRLTQIIDYWIGVPACLFLSALNSIGKLFNKKQDPHRPRKVLFIEISEMGSAIIAFSSIARTKQFLDSSQVYFLVFEKNKDSVGLLGVIPPENIITIPDTSFIAFAFGALKALLRIRSIGIDTTVDLELFSRFTALFSYLSGASTRVGFDNYTAEGLYRGNFITHRVFYNPHQHMSLNFLALVGAMTADVQELPLYKANVEDQILHLPKFVPGPLLKKKVEKLLLAEGLDIQAGKRIAVFNPDPGELLIRGWETEKFIEVARRLIDEHPDLYIAIIGVKRSRAYAEAFQAALGSERIIDLTGKTDSIAEVVTLFTMAKVLVGTDSGPQHFAALTDVSIVTLFGPETPALYGPLSDKAVNLFARYACSPCLSAHNHRHTACRRSRCLEAITVDNVHSAATKCL